MPAPRHTPSPLSQAAFPCTSLTNLSPISPACRQPLTQRSRRALKTPRHRPKPRTYIIHSPDHFSRRQLATHSHRCFTPTRHKPSHTNHRPLTRRHQATAQRKLSHFQLYRSAIFSLIQTTFLAPAKPHALSTLGTSAIWSVVVLQPGERGTWGVERAAAHSSLSGWRIDALIPFSWP